MGWLTEIIILSARVYLPNVFTYLILIRRFKKTFSFFKQNVKLSLAI